MSEIEGIAERARQEGEASGGKVTLIGWSLGGYLSREVARDAPALRSLSYAWFERSAAFGALKEAAKRGVPVLR